MVAHTAVANADPDEPERPMSAPRPDYLRPVDERTTVPRATNLPEDELRRAAVQLPAEARARLAAYLRQSVAHLDSDAAETDVRGAPQTSDPLGEQTSIVPPGVVAAVAVPPTGDLAALVHLSQAGPVQLVRDGVLVATLTGTGAKR